MSRDNDQKEKKPPYMEISRDDGQIDGYIRNELQLQNHSLIFNNRIKSLHSATSILSQPPMA